MKKLKSLLHIAAFALFASLLAACGESKNEDMEKVAVEYWQALFARDAEKVVKLINFPETTPERTIQAFKTEVQSDENSFEEHYGKLLSVEVLDAGIEKKTPEKGWVEVKITLDKRDAWTPVTRLIYTEKRGWLIREDWATQ